MQIGLHESDNKNVANNFNWTSISKITEYKNTKKNS